MIDTFQISKTFARPPKQSDLERNGWKPILNRQTGEVTALRYNSAKGEHQPRLTLSRTRNDLWIIRAEVSPGAWLYGSNLHLPDEEELQHVLDALSAHAEDKSGVVFDARSERVTRVDFTRDFQVGENAVLSILAKFGKLKIARYKRLCFDETSVYFKNAGKQRTKEFLIYSKYHERLANSENQSDQAAAKGLVRLEVSFRKSGVNTLAKSLKLKTHSAKDVLTKETSESAIDRAMKQLNFNSLLTAENANIEKLFEICDSASAFTRVGFLYLKEQYGEDLAKLPFINISPKTLKRYSDDCRKAGILSLE